MAPQHVSQNDAVLPCMVCRSGVFPETGEKVSRVSFSSLFYPARQFDTSEGETSPAGKGRNGGRDVCVLSHGNGTAAFRKAKATEKLTTIVQRPSGC